MTNRKELIKELEVLKASIEWELPITCQVTLNDAIREIRTLDAVQKMLDKCKGSISIDAIKQAFKESRKNLEY